MARRTDIDILIGEKGDKHLGGHILVTTPNYVKDKLEGRATTLDLTKLKMIVYDEADELFVQTGNHPAFFKLRNHLQNHNLTP